MTRAESDPPPTCTVGMLNPPYTSHHASALMSALRLAPRDHRVGAFAERLHQIIRHSCNRERF